MGRLWSETAAKARSGQDVTQNKDADKKKTRVIRAKNPDTKKVERFVLRNKTEADAREYGDNLRAIGYEHITYMK